MVIAVERLERCGATQWRGARQNGVDLNADWPRTAAVERREAAVSCAGGPGINTNTDCVNILILVNILSRRSVMDLKKPRTWSCSVAATDLRSVEFSIRFILITELLSDRFKIWSFHRARCTFSDPESFTKRTHDFTSPHTLLHVRLASLKNQGLQSSKRPFF